MDPAMIHKMGIDYLESRDDRSRYYDHRDHRKHRKQASPDESQLNRLTSTLSVLARKQDYSPVRDPGSLRLEAPPRRYARHLSPRPHSVEHSDARHNPRYHQHSEERYFHPYHHRDGEHHHRHHQDRSASNPSPPNDFPTVKLESGMYHPHSRPSSRPGPPGPYARPDLHPRPPDPYPRAEPRSRDPRAEPYPRPLDSYSRPPPEPYPYARSEPHHPRAEPYPSRPEHHLRPEHHPRPEEYPPRPEHHPRSEPYPVRPEHHTRPDPYPPRPDSYSRLETHSRPEQSRTMHHLAVPDRNSVSDSRRSLAIDPNDHDLRRAPAAPSDHRRSASPQTFITLDSVDVTDVDDRHQRRGNQSSSLSSSPAKTNPKVAQKIRKFLCSSDEEDSAAATRKEPEPSTSESSRTREHSRTGLIIRVTEDDNNRDVMVNPRPSSHRSRHRDHTSPPPTTSSSRDSSRHRSSRHHPPPPPAAGERKRRDSESSYVTISSDGGCDGDDAISRTPSKSGRAKKDKNDSDTKILCKKKRKAKKKKKKHRQIENEAENLDLLNILSEDYSDKETSACMPNLDPVKDESSTGQPDQEVNSAAKNDSVKCRKEKADTITNGTTTTIPCKKKKTAAATTTSNQDANKMDLRKKKSPAARASKPIPSPTSGIVTEVISSSDLASGSSGSPKEDSDINRLRLEAIESITRRNRNNSTEARPTSSNVTPLPAPSINFDAMDFTVDDATEISFTQDFTFDQNPHKLQITKFGGGAGSHSNDSDCEIIECSSNTAVTSGSSSSTLPAVAGSDGVYDFRSISNFVAQVRAVTNTITVDSDEEGEHHTTPKLRSKSSSVRSREDQEMYEKQLRGKELLEKGAFQKSIKVSMPRWSYEPNGVKQRTSIGLGFVLQKLTGGTTIAEAASTSSSEEGEIKSREGERPNIIEVEEMGQQMEATSTEAKQASPATGLRGILRTDTTRTVNSWDSSLTAQNKTDGGDRTEQHANTPQEEAGRQVTDMEIDDDDDGSNTESNIVLPSVSGPSVASSRGNHTDGVETSDTSLLTGDTASNADSVPVANTEAAAKTTATDVFDTFPYNDLLGRHVTSSSASSSPKQKPGEDKRVVVDKNKQDLPATTPVQATKTPSPPRENTETATTETAPPRADKAGPCKRSLPDEDKSESSSQASAAKQARLEPSVAASSTSSSEKEEDSDRQHKSTATATSSKTTCANGKTTEENHTRLLELLKRDEAFIEKYLKRKTQFGENKKRLQQNAERLEAKLATVRTELKNCERESKENEQQLKKVYERRLKRYRLENKYALELNKTPLRRMKTITATADASKKQVKTTTAPPAQRDAAKGSKSTPLLVSQTKENNNTAATGENTTQNIEANKQQYGEDARNIMAEIKQTIENLGNFPDSGSYPMSKSLQNNLAPPEAMVVATTHFEQPPQIKNTQESETTATTKQKPAAAAQHTTMPKTRSATANSEASTATAVTSQAPQRTTRSSAAAMCVALPEATTTTTTAANKQHNKKQANNKVATPMEVDGVASGTTTTTTTTNKTATGKSRDQREAEKTRLLETEKALKKDIEVVSNNLVKYQKINKPNTRKAGVSASSSTSTTTRVTKHSKINNNTKVVKKYKTKVAADVPLTRHLQQAVLTSKKAMASMKPVTQVPPHLLPLELPPKVIKPPPSQQPTPAVKKTQQQTAVAKTADNAAENQQKTKRSLSTLTEKQMQCLVNYVTKKMIKKPMPDRNLHADTDSLYNEAPKWMVEFNYDLSELAPKPRNTSDITDTCTSSSDLTYRSPLLAFHSYRLNSKFEQNETEIKVDDSCLSNLIDPHTIICSYDLTGVCCNPECRFQHLSVRSAMSAEQLYLDLLAYCPTMMKTSTGKAVTPDDPMEVKLEAAEATVKRLCGENKNFTVSQTARALALRINRALDSKETILSARQREFLPRSLGNVEATDEDDEATCGGIFFQLSTLPPPATDNSDNVHNPDFEPRPMGRYFTDCDVTFDEEVTLEKMTNRLRDEPLNTDLRLEVANRFLAAGKHNMALHVLCIGIENEEYCEEMWLAYVKPLRRYKLINDDGSFNSNQTTIVRQGLEIFPLSRVLWEEILCWEWPVEQMKSLYLEIIDNLSNRENIHKEEPVKGYLSDDSYYSRWLLSMVVEYIHFIKETGGIELAKQECEAQLKNFHENRSIVKAGGIEPLAMTSRDLGILHVAYIHLREFDSLPSGFYDDSVSTLRFGLCVGEKKIKLPFSSERKLHLTIEELNKMILTGVMICEDDNLGIDRNLEDLYPLYQALIDLKASERDWSGITVVFEDTMVRLLYQENKLSLACKEFCVLCMEKIIGSGLEVYITRIAEKAVRYFPRSPRVSLMVARYLWRAPRKDDEKRTSAEIATDCLHECTKNLIDSSSSNMPTADRSATSDIFRHMIKYDSTNSNQIRKYPIKFHSDVTVEDYESEKVYMWLSYCFLKEINRNSNGATNHKSFNRRDFDVYDAALNDVSTEKDRQIIWWYYLLSMRSSARCFNTPDKPPSGGNRREVEKRLYIHRGVWLKYFLSLVKHCLETSKHRYQYKAEAMLGYYHDFSFHNIIADLALDCFSRHEFVTISTTLAELMPKNIPFLLRMAHHFFQSGDHVSLSSLLWRLIKTHNAKEGKCTNAEIWKIVISSAYANGNFKELMKLVRQAGKAVPRSKDVWRQMIVLVMRASNKPMLESMMKPMDCLIGESFGGLVSELFATASKNK